MKKLFLLTKTLLVAALLCVGQSAWGETVGNADLSTGYLGAHSTVQTMKSGGTMHYVFTVTTDASANHKNWLLWVGEEGDDVTWANGLAIIRADNWEDKWMTSTTPEYGSNAGCTSTYDWETFLAFMNGATVDLTLYYEAGRLSMNATATKDETSYTYKFNKFLDGAPAKIDVCLSVNAAYLNITTADYSYTKPHYNATRYLQDFSESSTINRNWSFGGQTTGTQSATMGSYALYVYVNNASGGRNANLNLTNESSYFASVEDYCFEFDYNTAYASDGTKKPSTTTTLVASEGTVFYMSNPRSETTTIYNASNASIGSFTNAGYNTKPTTTYHFKVTSSSSGTYLTVTQGATEIMASTKINDGLVHLTALNTNLGRYYNHAIIDNLMLREYSASETVSTPSIVVSAVDGANRTISITEGTSSDANDVTTYYTTDGTDPTSASTVYSGSFNVSSACTIKAITISSEDTESSIASLAVTAGEVVLGTPTIVRTGANTYTISATATSTDGITADQTIHYTIGGGAEQTGTSLTNVTGDIVAWATATGFTNSANANMTYVAAIPTADFAWSYNLNSYPSAHSCTAIASAINTENGVEVNDETLYNLVSESYPNLLIENSTGWLLRNQSSNAWKCQSAKTKIAFNNVTTSDVIYIAASNDTGGKVSINSVTNGELKYNYGTYHYYIVPSADGAVTVTFETGSSINTVGVYNTSVSKTMTSAGWATYCSPYPLDFSREIDNLTAAYIITGATNTTLALSAVETTVAANTGLLLNGAEGTITIPVAESGTDYSETNKLVGVTTETSGVAAGIYVLMSETKGVGFYQTTKAFTVGANTAYLPSGFAGARQSFFSFGEDSETTGISYNRETVTNNRFYNLNGQRVAQPAKGLYIMNGKKVIIK